MGSRSSQMKMYGRLAWIYIKCGMIYLSGRPITMLTLQVSLRWKSKEA